MELDQRELDPARAADAVRAEEEVAGGAVAKPWAPVENVFVRSAANGCPINRGRRACEWHARVAVPP